MNDDLRAARPDTAPAAGPGPPRAASDSGPGGTARLARHVVESELENVLQSLFSVRQDLSELVGNSADRRRVESAMATMQGLIAAIRVLLAVLRAFGAAGADAALSKRLLRVDGLLAKLEALALPLEQALGATSRGDIKPKLSDRLRH